MEWLIWTAIFIVSLALLIIASKFFIHSTEKLGAYFRLSPFVIGVTLVGVGTSLPELASSILAVLAGSSEIVAANVIGSNITNILLILGLTAIIGGTTKIKYNVIHVDLPFFIGSTFLMAYMIWDGTFTLIEGTIFLTALSIYLYYTLVVTKTKTIHPANQPRKFPILSLIFIVISLVFIYVGAKYTIDAVINLSEAFNLGTEVISLIALSLGTSLPELTVSLIAVSKGKQNLAFGNILGSNIINSLAVMAIPSLFGTLIIPASLLFFGVPMMIAATVLFFLITQNRKLTRMEGWLFLSLYVFFIIMSLILR